MNQQRSFSRRRSSFARWLVSVTLQLSALHFATGCSANSPSAGMAPPVMAPAQPSPPPGAVAPAPPPPPSPGQANAGYAPPATNLDHSISRAHAEDVVDVQANYAPAAPAAAPPPPPMAAPVAPGRRGGAVAQAPQPKPPRQIAPPPPPRPPPPPPPSKANAPPAKAEKPVKSLEPSGPAAAPLLIYVGDVQMQVDEGTIPATLDRVIDIAESLGGYLAGRKDTSVQVRIPSQRFREGFQSIEKVGEVLHRSVSADDVSEQYSDLEVRLANLRVTHRRLQDFLARSGSIPEMLTVAKELERVAGEMEQIEGKMRFLRSRAAFSLITVAVQNKPKSIAKVVETKPPPPPPREVLLPIDWLPRVGLDTLLNLKSN